MALYCLAHVLLCFKICSMRHSLHTKALFGKSGPRKLPVWKVSGFFEQKAKTEARPHQALILSTAKGS